MNDKLLKKTKLFHSLTDEEMEQIINKMIVKQFKKNETILYEEDTNDFMYIILLGKVKVVRFYKAFKDYKHGNDALLKECETELFNTFEKFKPTANPLLNQTA